MTAWTWRSCRGIGTSSGARSKGGWVICRIKIEALERDERIEESPEVKDANGQKIGCLYISLEWYEENLQDEEAKQKNDPLFRNLSAPQISSLVTQRLKAKGQSLRTSFLMLDRDGVG